MSFHNVRLDEDVERAAQGGPGFFTTVLMLSSGYEKRNINWARARAKWELSYGVDTKENQEAVLAFFYARRGKAYGFRFKDWLDYQIGVDSTDTPQEIATGDNSQTQFQVVRRYTDDIDTFDREVTRLVAGTVRVFLDSVEQGAGWTVDVNTGVITFSGAPTMGQSIGVICEFDVPVRFDIDDLTLQPVHNEAFSFPSLPIIELRETLQTLS